MRNCIQCGIELPEEARFCMSCGANQEPTADASVEQQSETIVKVKTKKKLPLLSLIRNSVILGFALIIMVLSFLPVFSVNEELFGMDVEFDINAIESIVLTLDSFKSLDEEEILKSDIYEKMEEITEELQKADIDDPSTKDKQIIDKFMFTTLRLAIQSEDVPAPASLMVSAIFGIAMMACAVALFVVALLNLLATLGILSKAKKALHSWTVILLCAFPCVLLATHYIMFISFSGSAIDCSLSAGAIWMLVISAVVIIMTSVFRFIMNKTDKKTVIVPRAIAIVLSIMIVCLSFAPIMTTTVKALFDGSSAKREAEIDINVSFFDCFVLSESAEEQIDALRNYTKIDKQKYLADFMKNNIEALTKKEAEGALGKQSNVELLTELVMMKNADGTQIVFSLFTTFFAVAVISALIVLWQNIMHFALGKYNKKVVDISKIVCAASAFVALVVTVVFLVLANNIIDIYMPTNYSLSISTGIIFFFLFALGAVFCPSKNEPKNKANVEIRYTEEVNIITEEF